MKPRERVWAALERRQIDRTPRFEIWIDALLAELGESDPVDIYVRMGQDGILLPGGSLPGSPAWHDGTDEFGRVWRDGMYVGGAVHSIADLKRYSPPLSAACACFDPHLVRAIRQRHPNHCLFFGVHAGPLTAGYMAMGFEPFFTTLHTDPDLAHALLSARTEWCIALYREALRLGAEILVLGDDAAHRDGPFISAAMWRAFVLPYHRRIVESLAAPVIWHSDGAVEPLLPFAAEAGFAGVHGLEPAAGVDLARVKQQYGQHLVLIGNVDVRVLCERDLAAVRCEVDRCLAQGAPGGGFMLATCNSIFHGMHAPAVAEMFRYTQSLDT
jgi:uroporphyrinogen decarboxylase